MADPRNYYKKIFSIREGKFKEFHKKIQGKKGKPTFSLAKYQRKNSANVFVDLI